MKKITEDVLIAALCVWMLKMVVEIVAMLSG